MKLEDSRTLQCLINAFAGESEARNRYTFYSKIAQKEGFEIISDVFLETANNEMEHAKLFLKRIPNNTQKEVTGMYPIFLGNTINNLISAQNGEKNEWEIIYRNSSIIAKDEGFDEISLLFNNIANIEKRHAERYSTLIEEIKKETLYKKEVVTTWICRKCGNIIFSKEAPNKCPVCDHPREYFKIFSEIF